MACHRSVHHLHNPQPSCCSCCCSCGCPSSCYPSSSPHPAIPNTTTTPARDPLLQALAAHLLQSSPESPKAAYHVCNQHNTKSHYPPFHHYHHHHHHQQQQQQQQQQSLIQSLLRRIAALEATLPHLSSPPPPPPRNPSPPVPPVTPRVSIRDLAARTIQARFRLYLVRRSQTLRHLKHLASVRSHVAAIKASLSDEARLSPKAVSQTATDLLLQLDSIQSSDPMIREGKRSISRELVRLLELADGLSAKRHQLYVESMALAHEGTDRAAFAEESCPGIEELAGFSTAFGGEYDEGSNAGSLNTRASTPKTAKRVSFAENGMAPRVPAAAGSAFSGEERTGCLTRGSLSDDRRRTSTREPIWREVDGEVGAARGVEPQREGGSDEESPRGGQKAGIRSNGVPSGHKASRLLGLSAPLPLQMEPRRSDSK